MTDQGKQKLNEKMAKWCGFEFCAARDGSLHWFDKEGDIVSPTNDDGSIPFTDSMDACIKWVMPKIYRAITMTNVRDGWYCQLYALGNVEPKRIDQIAETMPLAFCLAVEKLISEVKA